MIVVRATMKVNIIPIKYTSIKINSSLMYNLTSSKTVAEIMTGIDKNNESKQMARCQLPMLPRTVMI